MLWSVHTVPRLCQLCSACVSLTGLCLWASLLLSIRGWAHCRWAWGSTGDSETFPLAEQPILLLQWLGQLSVEHLELCHGQQHVQCTHQPYQFSGELLHLESNNFARFLAAAETMSEVPLPGKHVLYIIHFILIILIKWLKVIFKMLKIPL